MMKSKTKLLLVEDDRHAGGLIQDLLTSEGYEVSLAPDGERGLQLFRSQSFDLCILDGMLPGLDGFEVAKMIKATHTEMPLLFLTAKSMKEDVLRGFDLGADDYLTKPFDPEELVYRVKAILRRTTPRQPVDETISLGQFTFDYKNQGLTFGGILKRMTRKESYVLHLLANQINQLVSKEELLLTIWGVSDYFTGRSLDVFITKLRKYLEKDPAIEIENVHSVGYILKVKN